MRLLVAQLRRTVSRLTSIDKQHGQSLVDQCVRAVFHFSCRIAFRMNVGNLLQLKRAFQSDWKVDAATEIKKVGRAEKLLRELFHLIRLVKQMFKLHRQLSELLGMSLCLIGRQCAPDLTEVES